MIRSWYLHHIGTPFVNHPLYGRWQVGNRDDWVYAETRGPRLACFAFASSSAVVIHCYWRDWLCLSGAAHTSRCRTCAVRQQLIECLLLGLLIKSCGRSVRDLGVHRTGRGLHASQAASAGIGPRPVRSVGPRAGVVQLLHNRAEPSASQRTLVLVQCVRAAQHIAQVSTFRTQPECSPVSQPAVRSACPLQALLSSTQAGISAFNTRSAADLRRQWAEETAKRRSDREQKRLKGLATQQRQQAAVKRGAQQQKQLRAAEQRKQQAVMQEIQVSLHVLLKCQTAGRRKATCPDNCLCRLPGVRKHRTGGWSLRPFMRRSTETGMQLQSSPDQALVVYLGAAPAALPLLP